MESFEYTELSKNNFYIFPTHFEKFGFNKLSLHRIKFISPFKVRQNEGPLYFLICFTLKCIGAGITHSSGGTVAGKYMIKGLGLLQLTKSGRFR